VLPAVVEFVDVAGLVAGASAGEGLGNQFLANIRECDAIAEVVRFFEDDDVIHVDGRVDPMADVDTIKTELVLADLGTVEKALPRLEKEAKKDKDAEAKAAAVRRVFEHLSAGHRARTMTATPEEREALRDLHLLTMKPMLYVANVAEERLGDELAAIDGETPIPISARVESELAELPAPEAAEYLESLGLAEPGLNTLIRAAYELLGLQSYFTAGEKEVRAWTVPIGAKAPQAAGVIHTDFERGFIKAEVIGFEDFVSLGGEKGAKEAGRMRLEGKEYVVQDGDVVHFKFNV
jgi:GTP-binding protein YchF